MMFCHFCQVVVLLTLLMFNRKPVNSCRSLFKQESGVCPDGTILRSGLCYFHIVLYQEYEAGKQACKTNYEEAVPATFRSKEDFDFINAQLPAEDISWIGLRKKNGTFMIWEDGSNLTYENFNSLSEASSDPDRNCVVVTTNGLWEARGCDHRFYIYCSLPATEESCENINCHDHATCYNTFLSVICVCNDGYAGDGKSSCIRSPGCPDDEWKEHKGICYRQVSTRATYEKARLICKSDFNASDLAKIRYKGDNDFLASSFNVDRRHWIGLRRRTNRWTDELTWEDNSTVMYTAFASNEPDNQYHCVFVRYEPQWYATDCDTSAQLFCSIDATKWGGARNDPGTGAGTVAGIIVALLLIAIGAFVGYKKFSHRNRSKRSDGSNLKEDSEEQ